MHEQPNLGKRVSVNLCHIAGLRISIVPLIESFYLKKKPLREQRISCILPLHRHVCICMHEPGILEHTGAGLLTYVPAHVHKTWNLRMEVG